MSDLEKLLQSLKDDTTSDFCCFDNNNILIESVEFAADEDPVVAAREIFVY